MPEFQHERLQREPELANDYFVRVIFEKKSGRWQTDKFNGKKLIRSAFGPDFDGVMLHSTMGGPEPDER
jgi:hypothetical protein